MRRGEPVGRCPGEVAFVEEAAVFHEHLDEMLLTEHEHVVEALPICKQIVRVSPPMRGEFLASTDQGNVRNRSLRSFAVAAARSSGVAPKISCNVRSVELWLYRMLFE